MKNKIESVMLTMISLVSLLPLGVQATDIVKANSTVNTNLSLGVSWTGGTAPGINDVATYSTTIASGGRTNQVDANISWLGLKQLSNINNMNIIINGSSGVALTLGASGVDYSVSRGNLTLNSDIVLGVSQAWSVTNAKSITVNGVVSGASGNTLTKSALGTLTLASANTYSGGTILEAGKLNVSNTYALGTGTFTIKGGTVNNISGAAVTVTNSLVINGDFSTDNNQVNEQLIFSSADIELGTAAGTSRTITATAAGTSGLSFLGSITNGATANSIVKLGPGGIVLSGDSTFSGGVTLSGGVLGVNSSSTATTGPLGVGTLTIGDSTVLTTGGTTVRTVSNAVSVLGNVQLGSNTGNGALTLAGAMNLNGGTRAIDIYNTTGDTLSGQISNGALTVGSTGNGNLTLSGNNTYDGDTVLLSTAKLQVSSDANLGTGTNITLSQNSKLITTASFATSKSITVNGSNPMFYPAIGTALTLNGAVSGSSLTPQLSGAGTLILNATNNFMAGSYFLAQGGVNSTLCLGNAYALNGTALRINGGQHVDNTSGADLALVGITALKMTTGNLMFDGTRSLDLSAGVSGFDVVDGVVRRVTVTTNTLTINGFHAKGQLVIGTVTNNWFDGSFVKDGAGTLVIKGASDYTLGTSVTNGMLRLAADNALPPGGAVTLVGGTLDMGAFTSTPSSLMVTNSCTLVLGAGQLSFTNQTADAWSGRLAITNELGGHTLRFQPALTPDQLGRIDYAGGTFYVTPDGYLRASPRGTIIALH